MIKTIIDIKVLQTQASRSVFFFFFKAERDTTADTRKLGDQFGNQETGSEPRGLSPVRKRKLWIDAEATQVPQGGAQSSSG